MSLKKKTRNPVESKLYCIDSGALDSNRRVELFTWNDACEVIEHYQTFQPEDWLIIREFEPI